MGSPKNELLRATLRQLEAQIALAIEEKRIAAGFHALEMLEADNQDAEECRAKARRLAAEASGMLESLRLVRETLTEAQ